jgi:putative component of membrane protein insertase Oxa1/YidC/SpoIIIJ protein YidD
MSEATLSAPGSAARMAAWSIRQYQQYISPHKGFVCAHRVLHRGESCSQYVLRIVNVAGVRTGIRAAGVRFRECRAAALLLADRRFEERMYEAEQEKRRRLNAMPGPAEHCSCLGQALPFAVCADLAPFACCVDW